MNKNDLCIGKFYKTNANYRTHCFRFKSKKDSIIHVETFFIVNDVYTSANISFVDDTEYEEEFIYEEIDIHEFMDYLSNDHIDKVIYNRRQKIKYLLNV